MTKHINRIHISYGIIVLLSAIAILQFYYLHKIQKENDQTRSENVNVEQASLCAPSIERSKEYRFLGPLLSVREDCESKTYLPIKAGISNLIDSLKREGTISSVSVYLQDFARNDWINYNGEERFDPGSLFKLPMLIAYLRMNEAYPGTLDRIMIFDTPYNDGKKQEFLSKSIKLGRSYTCRQLLHYTIAYSDNDAYSVLCKYVNVAIYQKTFTDLGLAAPDPNAGSYPITAKEYSVFLDALFNANYLSIKDSEFASELLSECDFTEGMRKSLPDSVLLIHKFGESGDIDMKEFHESGIIYLHNFPYLLIVMTKGHDMSKLPNIVRNISHLVYEEMELLHS